MQTSNISAPIAKRDPKILVTHGDQRIDDYFWLKEREDPEVLAYLNAENAYTEAVMANTKEFRETLYTEMVARFKQDDQSVPYFENGYWYQNRFEEGGEYPFHTRKKGTQDAAEEIILNVPEMAKPHSYFAIGSKSVSFDNRYLAFGEDTVSRRIYTIKLRDLETGEFLADEIPNTTGAAVWAKDNQHFFYTAKDPQTLRGYKIFRHKLGTSAETDVEVFHEADETFDVGVGISKSKKFIVIASQQTITGEYLYLDATTPEAAFKIFAPRVRGLEYDIDHFGDRFYIRTNLDAKNFRLMYCGEEQTTQEHWQELIPHRADVLFENMEFFKDYYVISERKAGITQLWIRTWSGQNEHYIPFEEEAYLAYVGINPESDTELLRIGYQSLTTPNSTFDYNMRTKEFALLKEEPVLGGFNKENYRSERVFVTARDGAQVPVSIVYHRDFVKDGKQPLLLYAYGSYGYSMEPYFSSARLSLLNRGFAYAIAHIRGGEEMGRHWYDTGKLLEKKNTFHDFIDCAEWLIANHYTYSGNLYAMGGSAGGLLMGAVVNFRPDLWKAIVASVPFVDVVTTMLDDTIPLTTFEYDEWGNPNEEEYYHYMKSYSPYDNVEAKDYPAMLVTTGLHDSQVQYWEPAKWVSKLRLLKTDQNPLLLHTNMEAGHGGASGRFARLKETAREWAFVLDLAGKVRSEK
jgi:oligopeptidase B